jgi:hypothetical protein
VAKQKIVVAESVIANFTPDGNEYSANKPGIKTTIGK